MDSLTLFVWQLLMHNPISLNVFSDVIDKGMSRDTQKCLCLHSGQTTGHSREHSRDLRTSGHFPFSCHKISTVNLRHSSHFGTKFNQVCPHKRSFPEFYCLGNRKSSPRETNDNYRDTNTSLHVSLRTRKFNKKIHYCCRDSFFVEKDI